MDINFGAELLVGSIVVWIWSCSIIMYALLVVAWWKIFTKAGVDGWMALVPFLNLYKLYEISWGRGWFFLLAMIPFVGVVIEIIKNVKLSQAFGHGAGFAIGLILLPNIFTLILGFGRDQYLGPAK